MRTTFEISCRNGKFKAKGDACGQNVEGKIVVFLSSAVYYFRD